MSAASANPRRRWGAVILAGGAARRLGGRDKARLALAGRSLLERALAAAQRAELTGPFVVVGPPIPLDLMPGTVAFTREDPPGGGPVAALYAGRDALASSVTDVLIWAVDMPGVDAGALTTLRMHAEGGVDGSVMCAPDGRRQLAYAVRCAALDRERPPETTDAAVHRLFAGFDLVEWWAAAEQAADIDTVADLQVAIERASGTGWTGESARLDR